MATEWGDTGGEDTGGGPQQTQKTWGRLAMNGKSGEEEGIPNDARMFGLGD